MATQVRMISEAAHRPASILAKDSARPWHPINPQSIPSAHAPRDTQIATPQSSAQAYDISAHSVQFVASPGQTGKLKSALPAVIREALSLAAGFAGCMVMVSDQEARLVTVVTLWTGKDRTRSCNENAARVKNLLFPYVDHWLRCDNQVAHFSMLSPLERKFQECCSSDR